MGAITKIGIVLIFVLVALVVIDYCTAECTADGFTVKDILQTNLPTAKEDDISSYFSNPSAELKVPQTVSFLQDVVKKDEESTVGSFGQQMASDLAKDSFNIKDFLPQEIHEEWFQTDLSNAQKELDAASLIDVSRVCHGIDTVGQSLKNPSYDIRGNIPAPKMVVSPFLNSSYDADTNLRNAFC